MARIFTHIFGELYFSGYEGASTHIVDTGDGLLLFDSGYPSDVPDLLRDMTENGLYAVNIRWIFHTHGHIDHMGGTSELVSLTGAKTYIGAPDADAANGRLPLSYAEELGMRYEKTFEPDFLINDGDRFRFGNTTVSCVATPGHTAGAMSYFFDVRNPDSGLVCRAGLHGGMGTNSVERWYLEKHHLPFTLRDDFRASMERIGKEKVDIFLGNHMAHNHTAEKAEKVKSGDRNAFVVRNEWKDFCAYSIRYLDEMLAREASEKNNTTIQ